MDRGGGGAEVNLRSESEIDLTGKVHQLPCCIKYTGPTSVSHYFKPKPTGIEVDGLKVEEAHFRGRKLQGTTLDLPSGFSGFVLGKKRVDRKNKESEEVDSKWEMKAKFHNITMWNHDNVPSQDDEMLRMFHWFDVAKALHQPVSAEDVESALNDQ